MLNDAVRINHYTPDDPERFATVRLSYPKISATAGPCGLWPADLGPSIDNPGYNENKQYYNFGCATQRNLAAMVANPQDLIEGQKGNGETVIMSSTKAIDTYREAKPTGAEGLKNNTTGGK